MVLIFPLFAVYGEGRGDVKPCSISKDARCEKGKGKGKIAATHWLILAL